MIRTDGRPTIASYGDINHKRVQAIEESELLLADAFSHEVVCLKSRMVAGLGVQALYVPALDACHVTVTLNGETETFPVPNDALLDAFEHPYAYGATLPL